MIYGIQNSGPVLFKASAVGGSLRSTHPYSFARSSPALYQSPEGPWKQAAANEMRIVPSASGGGSRLLLDGQRTNLIPGNRHKFAGWSASGGAQITITQGVTIPGYPEGAATRIQSTGGSERVKYLLALAAYASGGNTVSCVIQNKASTTFRFSGNELPSSVDIAPGQIKRATITDPDAASFPSIALGPAENGNDMDIYAMWPQLELGNRATPPVIDATASVASAITQVRDQLTIPGLTLPSGDYTVALSAEAFEAAPATDSELLFILTGGASGTLQFSESLTHAGVVTTSGAGSGSHAVATETRKQVVTVAQVTAAGISMYRGESALFTNQLATKRPSPGSGYQLLAPYNQYGGMYLSAIALLKGVVSPGAAAQILAQ